MIKKCHKMSPKILILVLPLMKELVLNGDQYYTMRNPPSWIVTHGPSNSVPLFIATLTQYNQLLT